MALKFLNNGYFAGTVGIGTNSPSDYYPGADNLVIKQASGEGGMSIITATDTTGAIYFGDGTTGDQQYRGGIGYTHSTDKLFLVSGGATKAWMDTDGNFGIGTPSPDTNLEVESASGGVLRLTSSDTTVLTGESIGKIEFKSNDASTGGNNVMGFINSVATNVGTRYALSFGTGDAAAAVERMNINNLGAVKFNNYNSTNNTGTPTYLLGTDASGNVVKTTTVPGSGAGPYLPLSAGPSYPLTGDLYQTMGAIGVAQTDQDYIAKIYELNSDGFLSLYTGQPTPLEKVRISSYGDSFFVPANNGKIGIGTTSPIGLLEVSKDSTTDGLSQAITVSSSSVTTKRMNIGYVPGSNYAFIDVLNYGISNTNQALSLQPNGGKVGIGTTSPNNLLNLSKDVANGDVATYIQNSNADTGSTNETTSLKFAHGNDAVIGYVGAKIVCGKEGDFETSIANIKGNLQFYTAGGTSLDSDVNNIERMRIDSVGTVLIGTTSSGYDTTQGYPLHAMSDLTSQSYISVARKGQTSGTAGLIVGLDTTNAYLLVRDNIPLILGNNNLSHVFIKPTGYVGIGASTPRSRLQVAGGIQMADDTDTASAAKVGTMRYRTGTEYVEVTGTELVTNGDFASSTSWELRNSASINNGTGVATVPGAGALGSTNGNWSLSQASVFAPSTLYKVRFQARRSAGTASEMYVGQSYSLKFNQVLTADWVQYEVVFTSTSNVGWSDLSFGGVVGTTSEVKEVSVVEVTAEDASYADMCMQTGASTYEWVNIVRNTY